MNMKVDIKDVIYDLAEQILYHKELYYDGYPEITDFEYDFLEERLKQIAPDHPVLKMVGYNPDYKLRR